MIRRCWTYLRQFLFLAAFAASLLTIWAVTITAPASPTISAPALPVQAIAAGPSVQD